MAGLNFLYVYIYIYILIYFRSGFGTFGTFFELSSFWPWPGATKLPAGPTFWPWQPFWRPCRPIFPSKATFWRLYRPILPYKTTFRQPFSPILLVLDDETCMTDPSTHKFNQTPPQSCGGHTLVGIIYLMGFRFVPRDAARIGAS